MSLLQLGLDKVPDLVAMAPKDYLLKVTAVKMAKGKESGNPFLQAYQTITAHAEAKMVTHLMMLPLPADEAGEADGKKRNIKEFCDAYGIDYTKLYGCEVEAETKLDNFEGTNANLKKLVGGLETWASLGVKNDATYGDYNNVKKWLGKK